MKIPVHEILGLNLGQAIYLYGSNFLNSPEEVDDLFDILEETEMKRNIKSFTNAKELLTDIVTCIVKQATKEDLAFYNK